jgi:hypothetical protein
MNLFQMLGTMMVPAGTRAYVVGAMMHAMMSVVFGLIHGLLYVPFDIDSNYFGWGLALGFGWGCLKYRPRHAPHNASGDQAR